MSYCFQCPECAAVFWRSGWRHTDGSVTITDFKGTDCPECDSPTTASNIVLEEPDEENES